MSARDRRPALFFRLLQAGLLMLLPVLAFWLAGVWYFGARQQQANTLVRCADRITIAMLEARRAEKDFLLRDAAAAEFRRSGISDNLTAHQRWCDKLLAAVAELDAQLPATEQGRTAQLETSVRAYAARFAELAGTYRTAGTTSTAAGTAWLQVRQGLAAAVRARRQPALTQAAEALQQAADAWRQQADSAAVALVLTRLAVLERTAADSIGTSPLAAPVAAWRTTFTALQETSGQLRDANSGVQGAMRAAIHDVETQLARMDEVREAADATGAAANRQLLLAMGGVLVAGLLLGVVISMLTARSLVRPLAALQQAVTALGSGQLGARAAVPVVREYALLAEGMNAMAEALAGLVRRIQRAGVQVTSSATQITAAARQLQTSVGEQTATTAQVGASVAEISATTQQLAGTIAHAAAAADASAGIAGHSVSDIAALTGSMRQLLTSTANLGGRFSLLSAKAQGIGSVVTTIAKVADQTNLLSLNAAIEAEKAGEAGLGFAVVAREIRRLADQSAIATADIEELIREMQGAVVGGVTGMDAFTHEVRVQADAVAAFGSKLEELIRQVQAVAPLLATVTASVQSQAAAAQQINVAMTQLGDTAQNSSLAATSLTEVATHLLDASRELQGEVARFRAE